MHKSLLLALATSTCNKASTHTEDGTDIYVQQCFSSEGSWLHVWVFIPDAKPHELDLTEGLYHVLGDFNAYPQSGIWDSM